MLRNKLSKLLAAALLLSPLCFSTSAFADLEGSADISRITRKSGGQWYRLLLQEPLSLEQVSVDVLRAKVKIHSASIITESQARLQLSNLRNTPILVSGQTVSSGYINRNDRIIAIDIRAESFGAYADIRVRAASQEDTPLLVDENQASPPPSAPTPRPRPPAPPPPPPPRPTPLPTPPPPEVIQLSYPFSSDPRHYSKIECSAQDRGWEEHSAHGSCRECLAKHGECVETCDVKYVRVFGKGVDVYGRIGKFEGRGPDRWSALMDMQRVCDFYRLGGCENDSARPDNNFSENYSRKSCVK